jgi:hypothetical protein
MAIDLDSLVVLEDLTVGPDEESVPRGRWNADPSLRTAGVGAYERVGEPSRAVVQLERAIADEGERSLVAIWMAFGTRGRASANHEDPAGANGLRKSSAEGGERDDLPGHWSGRCFELPNNARERLCNRRRRARRAHHFAEREKDGVHGPCHLARKTRT